jgi:hypothetical protein
VRRSRPARLLGRTFTCEVLMLVEAALEASPRVSEATERALVAELIETFEAVAF